MPMSDAPFEITVDVDALTVAVRGDIDMATAGEVKRAIEAMIAKRTDGNIVVDLANVGFIDSSAVGVLIQAWEATRRIVVRHPRPQALRVFSMTGIDQLIPVEQSTREQDVGAASD